MGSRRRFEPLHCDNVSTSTTKKAYLCRMDTSYIEGYVSPQTYQRPDGVEILRRSAEVTVVPYAEIRAVYFVKEFDGPPNESEKRVFGSRPKLDGLWVRLTFRDDEVFEGVIQNDLLLMGPHGITITPPDAASNTQRIFVPQQSLKELKVLSVIGSPVHRRQSRPKTPPREQIDLFSGRLPS
jgi:hypothetical protein